MKAKSISKRRLFIIAPILCVILATLIFFLVFVVLRARTDIYSDTSVISDVLDRLQPRAIMLDSITIIVQPDDSSCGITAVAIVSNYYNHADLDATALIERYNTRGSSHDDMIESLQGEIPGCAITLRKDVTDSEMLQEIHASLSSSNPVLICFGSLNPYNEPRYDFHASVVYGIDLDSETITIANTYGFSEEISLVDFLNRMSYTEIRKYPLFQQFVLVLTNMQNRNAYFIVD